MRLAPWWDSTARRMRKRMKQEAKGDAADQEAFRRELEAEGYERVYLRGSTLFGPPGKEI